MSETTKTTDHASTDARSSDARRTDAQRTDALRTDALWRGIIIAIFAFGVIVALGLPLITGTWTSVISSIPIFAFGILIAAIRSIRP
ncbi:hypothetical protein [Microbacterium sp. bgisy203]|uniref:hypothetical protein n=1 Tax=Microbacterium sp. bgisy203 TaxID=3413799 RepID=UPI003D733BA1